MSRKTLAGLLVFVVALALRVAYVSEAHAVLQLDVSRLSQTDNYVFSQWAQIIADGDLLCREQPHAYHHWTRQVAPESKWLEWYGGALTYHQTPLYPYFVAVIYKLFGVDDLMVGYAQALLGALTCWLTFVLGCRLLGRRGGLIAGLLLAFTGGYIFYDAFVLRDGPMAFLVVLTTLALDVAVQRGRPRDWILAGASLGLFTLGKETGLPLLALTLLFMGVAWRRAPAKLARTAALLVLGWALVTGPAFARNVVVGAPTFRLSTRGPEVFITGNAQGQTGVGWSPPVTLMRELLMESNFSLPRAMALTLATHRADPWGFARLLWGKTGAFLGSYEVPNNVNFYLHRAHLLSLRLGFVSLAFLTPAMLLGLVLGMPRRRRLGVTYGMIVAISASVVALYILARFRLQVLPLVAIFAALSVDWALRAWADGRKAALLLAAIPFTVFTVWAWRGDDPYRDDNKNTSLMLQLVKTGNYERALHFRDELLEVLARGQGLEVDAVTGDKLALIQMAFELFEEGMQQPEGSAARHLLLGRGDTTLLPVTKRGDFREFSLLAAQHLHRALELAPDLVGVRHALGTLEAGIQNHFETPYPDKNFGEAYRWFQRELELDPRHGPSLRDAGRLHLAWEQWPQALEHLLAAEAVGAADGEVLAAIARISVDSRFATHPPVVVFGEELPVLDKARAADRARRALLLSDAPNVLSFVSDVHYLLGEYDASIALLERLRELQPWRRGELEARIEAFRGVQAAGGLPSAEKAEGLAADAESEAETGAEAGTEAGTATGGEADGSDAIPDTDDPEGSP